MNKINSTWKPLAAVLLALVPVANAADSLYLPMERIGTVKVLNSAKHFESEQYAAENILDETGKEYSSDWRGVETFVDFDLGQIVPVSGFRHQQRNGNPDRVGASELLLSESADFSNPMKVGVLHDEGPSAWTYAQFEPVNARYVRWKVTKLGKIPGGNLGGKGVAFYTRKGAAEEMPTQLALSEEKNPCKFLPQQGVDVDSPYLQNIPCVISAEGKEIKAVLHAGTQTFQLPIENAGQPREVEVTVSVEGKPMVFRKISTGVPQRKLTIYVLPHSHVDNGFTELQPHVADRQVQNLVDGMALAKKTANYSQGARFVWNLEVGWAADLYLQRMNEQQRRDFIEAVKAGQVGIDGMYLNALTGLCRPEELIRLFRFSKNLEKTTGVKVDSAMISDVPGYVWGTVTAMNQAGIRYFSPAPNYFDRIGDIMVQNTNKPFWWVGPDGKSKVLVWIPYTGYAWSHVIKTIEPKYVWEFCSQLDSIDYPYDIAYIRWSGHGDNAPPDATLPDQIRQWNETHVSPKFVIATTHEAFSAFEAQYGSKIPERRGDWTPYWEDGAGSSAAETALNRTTSNRLRQVETLFAMLSPSAYPAAKVEDSWRDVLLYSEHTWGANCSVTAPEAKQSKDQWAFKKGYALDAAKKTDALLAEAAALRSGSGLQNAVDIFNTSSYERSELVRIPAELSKAGSIALDPDGQSLPSQLLSTGELAVRVPKVPAFGISRIFLKPGTLKQASELKVEGNLLQNKRLKLRVDEETGAISELWLDGVPSNLVDQQKGALNSYLYFKGKDNTQLEPVSNVRIRVKESGPLLASLLVERDAPGCKSLSTEIRLSTGADTVEIYNLTDKARLETKSYRDTKESLNFGFPFNIPGGEVRMDVPFGVYRPEVDQLPGSCKNWFSVGSWVDVSNKDYGVTWYSLDAPLVQLGELSANMLNSQTNPAVWRKKVEPTQAIYSWAMNNHWGVNYRAYQEGPVMFRYVLRIHQGAKDTEASRMAQRLTEPLLVLPGKNTPGFQSPVRVESESVVATALKPSDDGKGMILRLFNTADRPAKAKLSFSKKSRSAYLSATDESRGEKAGASLEFRGFELKTLRIED